jgi:hypothetical protein
MATKYGTPTELRSHMNKTLTADDDVLEAILEAASRNIDRACNRPDGFIADTVASARRYAGTGKPYIYIDECISVTTVEVKDSATDDDYDTWTTADWIAASGDPQAPDYNSLPYDMLVVDPTGDESVFTSGKYTTRGGFRPLTDVHRGVPTVRITARWGYSETAPVDVKLACLMQSARWYKRFQSAMSDTLASGELGMLLYRQSLDPDIQRLLVDGRYIKPTTGRR